MVSEPPGAPQKKRPWYLLSALLGALALGVSGGCDGYRVVSMYKQEHLDAAAAVAGVANDADRALLLEKLEELYGVLDLAKGRTFPLGVAALLIGSAVVLFAMRAMGGRALARGVLVQVAAVQGMLGCVAYAMQGDVRAAQLEYRTVEIDVDSRELPNREMVARLQLDAERWVPPFALALRSFGAIFIVVALTRPRSRQFFDASSDPVA